MIKKLFTLGFFVGLSALFWFISNFNPSDSYQKGAYSFIAITLAYFIFKVLLEGLVAGKIKDGKTRYSFRKTTSTLYLTVAFIVVLRIWIINPQALLVAYGLIGAGVAVSLQDFFKNVAGGIIIFISSPYRVGNRIEINSKCGDVLDINLLSTSDYWSRRFNTELANYARGFIALYYQHCRDCFFSLNHFSLFRLYNKRIVAATAVKEDDKEVEKEQKVIK